MILCRQQCGNLPRNWGSRLHRRNCVTSGFITALLRRFFVFHGRLFRDNELSSVYVYTRPVEERDLHLQEEEVESVMWMDYEECMARVLDGSLPNCIYPDEFRMVGEYLKKTKRPE